MTFTRMHRGGSGVPLLLLHGSLETWRTWELVLPALERHHDVLAPTFAGHAGGPPWPTPLTSDVLVDDAERVLDEAGIASAHVCGNSLGAYVALQLAARGRARSVVALAPAGGWADDDPAPARVLDEQRALVRQLRAMPPAMLAGTATTPEGRSRATALITSHADNLDAAFVGHLLRGIAACDAEPMLDHARAAGWPLDPARVDCPVRFVWGTADRLLPWPSAAAKYRAWFPTAEWIELDGVGHAPQLDVPFETAQLILGLTAP